MIIKYIHFNYIILISRKYLFYLSRKALASIVIPNKPLTVSLFFLFILILSIS